MSISILHTPPPSKVHTFLPARGFHIRLTINSSTEPLIWLSCLSHCFLQVTIVFQLLFIPSFIGRSITLVFSAISKFPVTLTKFVSVFFFSQSNKKTVTNSDCAFPQSYQSLLRHANPAYLTFSALAYFRLCTVV